LGQRGGAAAQEHPRLATVAIFDEIRRHDWVWPLSATAFIGLPWLKKSAGCMLAIGFKLLSEILALFTLPSVPAEERSGARDLGILTCKKYKTLSETTYEHRFI
jgi:hypothetical protein